MRILRTLLALLLAASLAATPAFARAVSAPMPAPDATAHAAASATSAMADCHGMKTVHEQQKPAGHAKSCPDCDKQAACDHDACQLKCFKVFADLPRLDRAAVPDFERLAPIAAAFAIPIEREPQTPPPRR